MGEYATSNGHIARKHKQRKTTWIIISIVLALIAAAVTLYFLRPDWVGKMFPNRSAQRLEEVVIPWNPGGMADLTARSILNEAAPGMSIRNVHGANGAMGLNEVSDAPYDGSRLLGTSLSSLVTLKQMGFTDTGHDEWAVWLTAYAPSIIAVSADSPYQSLIELITAARNTELICANAGNGTLGLVAANLFADGVGINIKHTSYSGSNPAINAVADGSADFIVALSSELIGKLRSGELRALAALSDSAVMLNDKEILPASNTIPELSHIEPFGEYYGFMMPSSTPEDILIGYDRQWIAIAENEAFCAFADGKGLITVNASRGKNMQTSDRMASLICWTLYDIGCINVSPDTIGIERYD